MEKIYKTIISLFVVTNVYGQVANSCLQFDGEVSSIVSSGDVNELDGVSVFTVETWLYIDQWIEGAFVYKKQEGADWKTKISMSLGSVSNKRMYFHISDGANKYMAIDNSSISVGNWHHIAVAYNGNAPAYDQIKVYIDGVEVINKWFSTGDGVLPSTTPTTSGNLEVGSKFNGKIDEFRIWSKTLTANELERTNTINKYHPLYGNLEVYYRADQSQEADAIDYVNAYNGIITGNVSKTEVTGNTTFYYSIVSGYVRENLFQRGLISDEYILNNNDLIFIGGVDPKSNGDLHYTYPDNDGTLINTNYLAQFLGRDGVLEFTGQASEVNCGKGLFYEKADVGSSVFTFESWVYIDEWEENSNIFIRKNDFLNKVSLSLGPESSKRLYFHINNGANTYAALDNNISIGQWHHIAVAYDGNAPAYSQISITIDGVQKTPWYSNGSGTVASSCSTIDSDFVLGKNFKGKIDDVRLWKIFRCPSKIASLMNGEVQTQWWEYSQMTGYWKVENALNPAKDLKNIKYDFADFKKIFEGKAGAKIRFAITKGNYKEMVKTDAARKNFASNVKELLLDHQADGVDLDFEWSTSIQEWADYSTAITTLKDSLPLSSTFSVSLHSYYYGISQAAINAIDFASIQVYGPQMELFPYSRFVSDFNAITNYGFPANKLVMGIPFYGTTYNKRETAYKTIINEYPNLAPDIDTVQMTVVDQWDSSNGNCVPDNPATYITTDMIFNGVNTIIQKSKFVKDNNCLGIMYWDSSTDVDYTNSKSLLRALNSVINSNVDDIVSSSGKTKQKKKHVPNSDTVEEIYFSTKKLTYPNPTKDYITIKSEKNIKSIIIFNQSGQKVFESSYLKPTEETIINLSNLINGLYFVKINLKETSVYSKILKQ